MFDDAPEKTTEEISEQTAETEKSLFPSEGNGLEDLIIAAVGGAFEIAVTFLTNKD